MEQVNLKPVQHDAARQEADSFLAGALTAVDLDGARGERRERINRIKNTFCWQTPEQLGAAPAAAIAEFAEAMVRGVRATEPGLAHQRLAELRCITSGLAGGLEPNGRVARWLFSSRRAFARFAADWNAASRQIDELAARLDREWRCSAVSIENLRRLRETAIANLESLAVTVVAGRELLAERRRRLDALHTEIEARETIRMAHLRGLEQQHDLLRHRLHRLERARSIAADMIPLVQQTLHGEIVVSEQLDMALTQAIPVLKQQLSLVAERVQEDQSPAQPAAEHGALAPVPVRLDAAGMLPGHPDPAAAESPEAVCVFLERIDGALEEIDRCQAQAQGERTQALARLEAAMAELVGCLDGGRQGAAAERVPETG